MLVLIRGAGDIASGIAIRLWRSGIRVIMTDLPHPTSIRRTVCFSEALLPGSTAVEDVTAEKAENYTDALRILSLGRIPVLADPQLNCLAEFTPDVLIDAILAKKNLGTTVTMAPVVIGVGPGFTAGADCHAVIETMRGHTLGRVIRDGSAIPNTNIPGLIGGYAGERVLRAPADGEFIPCKSIGDLVDAGDTVGSVEGIPMKATIGGVLRGLLPAYTPVTKNMKSGDVDPRGDVSYCYQVSDKALAVGGGALEACLALTGTLREPHHAG